MKIMNENKDNSYLIYDNLWFLAKIKLDKQFQRYNLIELVDSILEKDSSFYNELSKYLVDKLSIIENAELFDSIHYN